MKNQLKTVALLIATGLLFSACLSHDDNSVDYSFYNDTAITAFSLGTLTKTAHTTASTGEDSVYTESFAGSAYKFYIDQERNLIYNPDSLPYSTDVSRVLTSITTKNSGLVYLKDNESISDDDATFTYLTSTDSVDFSQARTLRVLALNGQVWRDYTVQVNVHQEAADTMKWQKMSEISDLAQMSHLRVVTAGEQRFILGSDGTQTQLWASDAEGSAWAVSNTALDADAWKNAVAQGSSLFILSGGNIVKLSSDGQNTVTPDHTLQQFAAASATELYALSADGQLMASADGGTTWTEEEVDDSSAPLPTDNLSFTIRATKTNSEISRLTLFGTTNDSDYLVAWTKLIDSESRTPNHLWSYVDAAGDTRYAAPKTAGITVVDYDDTDMTFGLNSDGTMATILQSYDSGITWKTNTTVTLPDELAAGEPFAITTDAAHYLWLVDHSGQIWRGRINRLGWRTEKQVFD